MRFHRLTSGVLALTGGILLTVEPVRAQTGACCQADGTCIEEDSGTCTSSHCAKQPGTSCADDADCIIDPNDFGPCVPRFLGDATSCAPNCCPQAFDSGGVCCMDEWRCTDGLMFPCGPSADGAPCPAGDGSCVLMCPGPFVHQITVPPLIPPDQAAIVDITSDATRARGHSSDECAGPIYDGVEWYHAFTVDDCAVVTWTFCCNEPPFIGGRPLLSDACSCPQTGPVNWISPNPGRSGFGDSCGNNHCCSDGNYSVEWTVPPGKYLYLALTYDTCEGTGDSCLSELDCEPGVPCIDLTRVYQSHIYVEPCLPSVCCNDAYPCDVAADCPPNPENPDPPECVANVCADDCSWLSKFECQDSGGDWLGDLSPSPGLTCLGACSQGACCLYDGSCEDQNGDGIGPAACEALPGGDYHGGVRCADKPCTTCEFNMIGSPIDHDHCQGETGQYLFASDRFQGTRRADDFRPQDSPIRSICFVFGYLSDGSGECSNDPPPDDFHIEIYEDAFGFPGTMVPDSPGAVVIDGPEPIPSLRAWQFHAAVGGADGVEVIPGECYWLEITGMGDDECSTLWAHSVDGNNYGMRDDNNSYGPEDIRDGDTTWCLDSGIVVPPNPGTDGGCGDIPVACCHRGARGTTCDQITFNECSDLGSYGFPYSTCGGFECPDPPNDVCDTDDDGTPDGAARICEGNPDHPEWGEWIFWDGETPETRLGQCNDWPGEAGFGQICHPQTQDCRDPASAICLPHGNKGGYPPAYECYVTTDNRLATTDGPVGGGECGDYSAFQADVWHLITAPCSGRAVVTMCDAPSEYDGILSVYGNHTADLECPGPGNNVDLLECNDEYCRGSSTVGGVHFDVVEGAVYLLRQGGYSGNGDLTDAAQGISEYHIGFLCDCCPDEAFELALPPNVEHHARKHRYISIDATTSGAVETAIKVEIAEMNRCQNDLRRSCIDDGDCPTVCAAAPDLHSCGSGSICPDGVCIESGPCGPHPNVGMSWFVQEPQTRGTACPNGMCYEEDYYARVGPDEYVSDWKSGCEDAHIPGWYGGCSTLHIGDCEIVPGVKYNVYACLPDGGACTDPLVVETTRKSELMPHYGDVAGPVTPELIYTGPDDYTSVIDIGALLLTMKNWGTTNLPQAHTTWVDLVGLGPGLPPDYILNISDLNALMRSFVDIWPWENSIGGLAPGDCP